MEKPPTVIEGRYRVLAEAPKREPFFGPGASFSSVLSSLFCGCGLLGAVPPHEDQGLTNKWVVRLVMLAYFVFCAIAHYAAQ